MEELIKKYKSKIAVLMYQQRVYSMKGMGGACLSLQGEIQA
jgi:hypothetical protein